MTFPGVSVDRSRSPSAIAFAPGFNVAAPFIDRHVPEGRGAKVAIRCAAGEITYAGLAGNVNRAGNALLALGVRQGDRVLMVMKDSPEFFYVFWGAIKAGILPVPLNVILRASDYRTIVEDSACAAVIFSPEFAGELEPALGAGPVALPVEGEGESLRARLAAASDQLVPAPADAMADCFLLYTSGSTGRPKGVVHRHRDMVVTSELFGRGVLGIGEDDVLFSSAKLFFAYGLGNAMTFPLWCGATSVLLEARPTAKNTLETIERFRPTLYFGVPTLYASQLQALESMRPDLSSVRLCVSAGEPMPKEMFRRWKERTGLDALDGLGSTEALNTFLSNRPGDVRPGTSGRPVPGYEVRILVDGEEAKAGEPGRLQVSGGSTAARNWNNPLKTAQTMQGEWLDTGDTYFRDEDGYYHFCGRTDDMLKVSGMWCSPAEIEARLADHPAVLEAAVVGIPDASGLVKPEAWVVLREGVPASESLAEELMAHCKQQLAPYKFPRRVHFSAGLPKTATGKIQRFLLRPGAEADQGTQPSRLATK
ncbi:MAG TPA: benzoate-CoA ligase family protein [Myxococcales bacterium]|nr:benzoate-CoA ligase family protein [Myxococcales bacterium]